MSNFDLLKKELRSFIPLNRIFTDKMNLLAYGTDASFYRLIPQIVIKVSNTEEIKSLIKSCSKLNIPLTFRAAGTSLSGQAITNSVLAVLDRNWNYHKISNDNNFIDLAPAITGGFANAYLKQFNKKIGPDPASINSAMIGGIAANNASGMCCGTSQNSYKTLKSMKLVFADGSELNTGDNESIDNFKNSHPQLIQGIKELASKTKKNKALAALIEKKYKLKNTTGYSLNSLIDFEDEIDIIQHLMIGSEGTLGFISEITYKTIDEAPLKASSLALFRNFSTACKAVPILKKTSVDAVELMDRASLRSVENKVGMPEILKTLDNKVCSLLIECSANTNSELNDKIKSIKDSLVDFDTIEKINFTSDFDEYSQLWKIRKGLFPSVGAMREAGTTVVIEDVAFPLANLAEAGEELKSLFIKYGFNDAIIFGHALEGNFHFVFNQDFNDLAKVDNYKRFMEEVVHLTATKYHGSLKAEHGTGRNMAPFVELEWGKEAYKLMQEIKNIFDPKNILNPGVILNPDKDIHTKNLKPLPKANPIIDKCIECGFCETNCPSKNLTLTPRQRIAIYREISRLKNENSNNPKLESLENQFNYSGEETCAVDGLCELNCPVGINTGKLIKELRSDKKAKVANEIATIIAINFQMFTTILRFSLSFIAFFHKLIGTKYFEQLNSFFRKIFNNKFPKWNKWLPSKADNLRPLKMGNKLEVVYFPSCISRTMGLPANSIEENSQTTVMISLLNKAGYDVIYPENIHSLCCGMPWASKGFNEQATKKSNELIQALIKASKNGELPILFDTSPCALHINEFENHNLKIYEPIEFINDFIIERLAIKKTTKKITIHTTCSSTKLGVGNKLLSLAEKCANEIVIPENISCCGVAGDRVFTHPELSESALEGLKEQVKDCEAGYSNSKTCEIGLSNQTGIEYKSIVYLVDEVSK